MTVSGRKMINGVRQFGHTFKTTNQSYRSPESLGLGACRWSTLS